LRFVIGGVEHAGGSDETEYNHEEVKIGIEKREFRFNDVACWQNLAIFNNTL
jgi:hypothetical protein